MKSMKYTDVMLMPWKWGGRILVGGTPETFQTYAKRWLDVNLDCGTGTQGHSYVEWGNPWVIWIKSLHDIPALAHEALHVTSGVLASRGLSFADPSEEAYTYTMEDLLRQVLTSKRWRKVR